MPLDHLKTINSNKIYIADPILVIRRIFVSLFVSLHPRYRVLGGFGVGIKKKKQPYFLKFRSDV